MINPQAIPSQSFKLALSHCASPPPSCCEVSTQGPTADPEQVDKLDDEVQPAKSSPRSFQILKQRVLKILFLRS